MIDLNHNRACELSEAKHDKNIIFNRACELDEVNHVRFSRFAGQAIIQLKSKLYYDETYKSIYQAKKTGKCL